MLAHFKNQKVLRTINDEIQKKIAALQEKWASMEDSYEKRDMSTLLFTDFSMLGEIDFAILTDNIQLYTRYYNEEQSHWRRHLDLAALCGSENVGEFIIDQKNDVLNSKDYGIILGYISSSLNHSWARNFSKKISTINDIMPDSVYFFCDDYDLIEDIKKSFTVPPASLKVR